MEKKRDGKEFAAIYTRAAQFFGRDLDKTVMGMYFEYLSEFTLAEVKAAFVKACETDERFPLVARLRKLMAPPEDKRTVATEQAHRILAYIKTRKYTPADLMADPVTRHLFESRWDLETLRQTMTVSEEQWFVREFVEAYGAISSLAEAQPHILESNIDPTVKKIADGLFENANNDKEE